ncbi:MAG: hypothetical protein ACQET5_08910 [Halobacteriota archaeon]
MIKTTADRYAALAPGVDALRPYEVPCIERFEPSDAPDRFVGRVDDGAE